MSEAEVVARFDEYSLLAKPWFYDNALADSQVWQIGAAHNDEVERLNFDNVPGYNEKELTALATWWCKRNPNLLHDILSPEQVEALKWAEQHSRATALVAGTQKFHDAMMVHNDAIKSLLGEEVDRVPHT